jgi:hypothetical protein
LISTPQPWINSQGRAPFPQFFHMRPTTDAGCQQLLQAFFWKTALPLTAGKRAAEQLGASIHQSV